MTYNFSWSRAQRVAIVLLCWFLLQGCGGGGTSQAETVAAPSEPSPAPPAASPAQPFSPGESHVLAPYESINTQGLYPLNLYLPANIESNRLYPTLVVLDGEWLFEEVVNTLDTLELEVIVIAVANDDADGYQHREDYATWPLAESYYYFLRDELIPAMRQDYAIDTSNLALIGHSYQGLFTTIAYLIDDASEPMFRYYAALDPSIWHQPSDMSELLQQRVDYDTTMLPSIVMVGATGELGNSFTVNWFANEIVQSGLLQPQLEYLSYDTSHRGVIAASMQDVLERIYLP